MLTLAWAPARPHLHNSLRSLSRALQILHQRLSVLRRLVIFKVLVNHLTKYLVGHLKWVMWKTLMHIAIKWEMEMYDWRFCVSDDLNSTHCWPKKYITLFLKSEILCLVFRQISCLKSEQKCPDFNYYTRWLKSKLFGSQIVIGCLKSILAHILDTICTFHIQM